MNYENPSFGVDRVCGTCKHWSNAEGDGSAHGYCDMNTYPVSGMELWTPMLTLDLATCSKWQEKEESIAAKSNAEERRHLMLCESLGAPTNMTWDEAAVWIAQNLPPSSLVRPKHLAYGELLKATEQ